MPHAVQGPQASYDLQNIQSSPNMSPEEAANHIWNKMLQDLQSSYNQEIVKIQQDNINNPVKMQKLIQELGQKYQQQVQKLSEAYNDARVSKSPEEIHAALDKAQKAIDEMGAKPTPQTPAQKEAEKIDKEANDIALATKGEINKILNELENVETAIKSNEALIAELEKKITELSKTDPETAAQASEELTQAKKDLESLKSQAQNLGSDVESLKASQSQIDTSSTTISSLYQAIINGQNVEENLQKLQAAFGALQAIQGATASKTDAIKNELETIAASNTKLSDTLKSIDIAKSGGVDPKPDPAPWSAKGQEAYIDITLLPYWSFMDYSMWKDYPNGIIPAAKLEKYLESLFNQMKEAGVNQIDIAFAQFGSIDDLLAMAKWDGNPDHLPDSLKNSSSLIAGIMRDYPVLEGNGQTTNAFMKFLEIAKKYGMKIDLSIGGESAGAAKICKEGETAAGQAAKLAELMAILGIDKVDFDLENAAIVQENTTEELREYFSAVHKILSAQGKETTLTTMGSINDWVGAPGHEGSGFFHDMFFDDDGNSIFNDMFDNLNLMLYGGDTSYLDIGGKTGWGIDSWLDVIGKENAHKIHIGFEDLIDYSNPNNNQGSPFEIRPGSTSGEAAAQIFNQIKEKLEDTGYSSDLGNPFWWPEYRGEKSTRYQPKEDGTIDFKYDTEKDFWKELNKLQNNSLAQKEAQTTENLLAMYRIGAA